MNDTASNNNQLRLGAVSDVDEMIRLERLVWPTEIRASREAFLSRLAHFSAGVIGACVANRLVGLSTSMMITWAPGDELKSWESVTDHGMIGTHRPDGTALYVVSIGAEKSTNLTGIGAALIQAQVSLSQRLGLKHIVLGSRAPGYREWRNTTGGSIDEYVLQRGKDGLSLDPLLRFFTRQGFSIQRTISEYMENDPESLNYGVIMFRAL